MVPCKGHKDTIGHLKHDVIRNIRNLESVGSVPVHKCTVGAVSDFGPKFSTHVESSILPANGSKLNPRRRSPST